MNRKRPSGRAGSGGLLGRGLDAWGQGIKGRVRSLLNDPAAFARDAVAQGLGYADIDALDAAMRQGLETGRMGLPQEIPFAPGVVRPISGKFPNLLDALPARDPMEVKAAVGLEKIPEHVYPYGDMMNAQAAKQLTDQDVMRAYNVTQSSIQRGARRIDPEGNILKGKDRLGTVPEYMMEAVEGGSLRPEDAMAQWLRTPMGQRYIEAASQGKFDSEAAREAFDLFGDVGFGLQNKLLEHMHYATKLRGRAGELSDLAKMSREVGDVTDPWFRAVSDYHGVGPSKAGFYGSMLGYGDLPVLDARQIGLHYPDVNAAKRMINAKGGEGGTQMMMRLREAQRKMGIETPERYQPDYQSLVHHAGWDKAMGEETSHLPIIRLMLGDLL